MEIIGESDLTQMVMMLLFGMKKTLAKIVLVVKLVIGDIGTTKF